MTATDTTTNDGTTNDGTTNDPGPIGERDRFDSLDPASGEVVGTHPVHSAADVAAAVARARTAATSWAALDFDGRAPLLRAWKALVTHRADELADLVHAETGKPHGDAMLEIVLAVDHLAWAGGHAEKVLRRRRVSPGLLMANHAATLEYLPLGVIGVIGPWNYPVFTPMGSIAYALAAGNAVVFKPSEHTPGVGEWLAEAAAEAIGIPGLFEVVTGFGATGGALVTARVDKIAFTGSTATAKKIMAAAADTLTPVLIECGGKDAMVVDADADVAAAADAATWGALSNAGQTCVGVERAYVHTDVYDAFVEKVVAQASEVDAGSGPDADIGPITMPGQLEVIRSHIADALARGGRALIGGADAVDDRYARPTVLVDVPEDALANTDETFGPTLTIARVRDMDEAVTKANASRYGLGATVFSKARGPELARRLRSGMTAVNSVISFAGIPSLPFGGVGDSGFGRIHGADGLREFTRAKAVARQRMPAPLNLTTFSRGPRTDRAVKALVGILHGRGPKRA
ncbi:aldehyde dehydrogenase family protein [Iamia sp.]|uniref:aldehyde dehydrogenase family protein n=1 Tax=Iamia sp. TaxID=2722710 RepID=UPI002B8DB4A4|nr:aldehyde dehydrogenase family protein [Iamia sp.]HXH57316.1 aldehyde dehydrogenase family protein [Iamia sp.]